MASIDFGVITIKNNHILEETVRDGWIVSNGATGLFKHEPTGVVFYRTSITDSTDIDTATTIIRVAEELSDKRKKVFNTTIKGLTIKTKEIYPHTYLTKFKDENGDKYVVIHGYDVGFENFWDKRRGELINRLLERHTK